MLRPDRGEKVKLLVIDFYSRARAKTSSALALSTSAASPPRDSVTFSYAIDLQDNSSRVNRSDAELDALSIANEFAVNIFDLLGEDESHVRSEHFELPFAKERFRVISGVIIRCVSFNSYLLPQGRSIFFKNSCFSVRRFAFAQHDNIHT